MVVTVPGTYLVNGNMTWDSSAAGFRRLAVEVNGTGQGSVVAPGSALGNTQQVSALVRLAAGDTVTLEATQSTGSTLENSNADMAVQWMSP